ncbi:succinate--CoA ligase subunit alpha [Actinobaculum sp. 313]|uniref:succinate--CoA ligase subunit alpha n=1 Tax=Actinobaculum sp. 313 TaxID=2495645 RepID=UPI000D526B23|nr:succinate--CoA ligase subunit alpha [Actinobaculum sp. 313]AWE42110.1 succinate--CoA ligase subunit alpha [Actinobaculum sp. 313]
MAILLNANSKVIVQGMTGSQGMQHTRRMLASGTRIVGGVNPRKAGKTVDFEVRPCSGAPSHVYPGSMTVPVYGTVGEARAITEADVSVVFVPPPATKRAVMEAVAAGIRLVVVITDGVPVADSVEFIAYARACGTTVIGPNCPGIITPGSSNAGIIPADITRAGPVGLVSRSGTLTYQMMDELSDLGFSTCIGIGGDPVIGTTFINTLAAFEEDPATKLILMIGEIGGDAEEQAASFIKEHVTKPVVAYVAGVTAPEGKTMGHAGAIVSGKTGTAESKKRALEAAGAHVGHTPSEAARVVRELLHS